MVDGVLIWKYEGGVWRLNNTVKRILWEMLLRSFADIMVTQRHA